MSVIDAFGMFTSQVKVTRSEREQKYETNEAILNANLTGYF